MKHLDLFTGILGFTIAAQSVWGKEYENVGFCDNEPFSQAIIKKHYPYAKIFQDIKTLKGSEVGAVDLVTGGFPCQPFSAAGKRRGKEDDRHLWPEMLRVIRETTPRWVIGENVSGFLTWNGGMVLDEVFSDLEAQGYEVWAFIIPACAVEAPHRRDRVWIIANRNGFNLDLPIQPQKKWGEEKNHDASGKNRRNASNSCSKGCGARNKQCREDERGNSKRRKRMARTTSQLLSGTEWFKEWPAVATRLCVMDDGISGRLARPRGWRNAALKGAGNAIVPQVAEQIFKAIKEIDSLKVIPSPRK